MTTKRWILVGTTAILSFIFLLSFRVVPPGHTGVRVTAGNVSEQPVNEGLTFRIPFVQSIRVMDNRIQGMQFTTEAVTNDLQAVTMSYTVNYSLSSDMTVNIFQTIGMGYQSIIVRPIVEETIKDITARYPIEQLITERARVSAAITSQLQTLLGERGLVFERFNIENFAFGVEFSEAIEAVRIAEQAALRAEQDLARVEFEAQADIVRADAEARAAILAAEAQAEMLRLQAQELTEENIVALWIERWNGVLPQFVGGDGGNSFMFPLPSAPIIE